MAPSDTPSCTFGLVHACCPGREQCDVALERDKFAVKLSDCVFTSALSRRQETLCRLLPAYLCSCHFRGDSQRWLPLPCEPVFKLCTPCLLAMPVQSLLEVRLSGLTTILMPWLKEPAGAGLQGGTQAASGGLRVAVILERLPVRILAHNTLCFGSSRQSTFHLPCLHLPAKSAVSDRSSQNANKSCPTPKPLWGLWDAKKHMQTLHQLQRIYGVQSY